jgi:hypothetical protein
VTPSLILGACAIGECLIGAGCVEQSAASRHWTVETWWLMTAAV